MGKSVKLGGTLALALVVVTVAGCGGGGPGGETSSNNVSESIPAYVKGPTREFYVPGGDNIVQTFGHEATPAERAQATKVVQAWLRAREAKDWTEMCRYMARGTAEELALEARRV